MKIWKAAAYLRLSREDEIKQDASLSIKNQKKVINNWVMEHPDIQLVEYFVDDGYSGATFERPAWNDLMFYLRTGEYDCLIVKDLSRLGRNTVKVTELKDEIFPKLKTRFIAIYDNVDTKGKLDDNDMSDFKILINEYYLKDCSKKIRSSLRASAKNGEFVGSFPPYGYLKDVNDIHKLILDEEVSEVVVRIFSEFAEGKSGREISDGLNRDKIMSPLEYRYFRMKREHEKHYQWNTHAIYQILHNKVYYGHMVQHKYEVVSYKVKNRQKVDDDEVIFVPNTHPAIINGDLAEKVEKRFTKDTQYRSRKCKNGKKIPALLSGMLECADCGNKLAGTVKHGNRVYRCSRYNDAGTACTSHYVREDHIIDKIKQDIIILNCIGKTDFDMMKNEIYKISNDKLETELKEYNNLKLNNVNRRKEIECILVELYEDKLKHRISAEIFGMLSSKYNKEINSLLRESIEYDKIMARLEYDKKNIDSWIATVLSVNVEEELTKSVINELIEKIYVYDVNEVNRFLIVYKIGNINELLKKQNNSNALCSVA